MVRSSITLALLVHVGNIGCGADGSPSSTGSTATVGGSHGAGAASASGDGAGSGAQSGAGGDGGHEPAGGSGGDTTVGVGATSAAATSGGATSGDATSGGATSGGATSGGATSGGATSGGATTGDPTGGATSGGATSGGAPGISVTLALSTDTMAAGDNVTATVTVTGFVLQAPVGQPSQEGFGHFHIYLDDAAGGNYLVADHVPQVTVKIPAATNAGAHTLRVALGQNNHAALVPPVEDSVAITVTP